MMSESRLVRRSNVRLRLDGLQRLREMDLGATDAVTIDFTDSGEWQADRAALIDNCGRRGIELFVAGRARQAGAWITEAVCEGVAGITLVGADATALGAAAIELDRREVALGLEPGVFEVILILTGAASVWKVAELLRCTTRVRQVVLDEVALCVEYGVAFSSGPVDPCSFARGRVISQAISAGVQPVAHPGPGLRWSVGKTPDDDGYVRAIRNLGFKGMILTELAQAECVNASFTPNGAELSHWQEVHEVFEAGLASGRAAVPLNGQMIDIPVAKRAQSVLALGSACLARDRIKSGAADVQGLG